MKTKTERIAALIADENSPFQKEDQAQLEACSEAQLAVLESHDRGKRIKALIDGSTEAAKPEPKPEPKAEIVDPNVAAKAKTEDEYIAEAPAGVREILTEGLRVGKERKATLIKALKDTKRCEFTDAQLGDMSQGQLDTLIKLAGAPKVDFGGAGAPKDLSGANSNDAPAPPSLVDAIKAAQAKK